MTQPLPSHVNMADVAARAGVSIATVSRALRDLPGVGSSTRIRIKEIAEELSYVVSPEASRLAGRETHRVALVVPRADVWFYSAMLASIDACLTQAGFDVLLYQVDGVDQRTRFFRDLPARRKVDAVVLIALPVLADEAARLDLMGVHVVVVGGRLGDHPHVAVDDRRAGAVATQHLIDHGHCKIAMIRTSDAEGTYWSSDAERLNGYRDALEANGIPAHEDYVVTVPRSTFAGVEAMSGLLDLDDPPTAVFAYSDELALGALQEMRRRGLTAPDDISLIGVDGHPLAELFDITTVDQCVSEQGRVTAEMLTELMSGRAPAPEPDLPSRLVIRGSTGPPRSASARLPRSRGAATQ